MIMGAFLLSCFLMVLLIMFFSPQFLLYHDLLRYLGVGAGVGAGAGAGAGEKAGSGAGADKNYLYEY